MNRSENGNLLNATDRPGGIQAFLSMASSGLPSVGVPRKTITAPLRHLQRAVQRAMAGRCTTCDTPLEEYQDDEIGRTVRICPLCEPFEGEALTGAFAQAEELDEDDL